MVNEKRFHFLEKGKGSIFMCLFYKHELIKCQKKVQSKGTCSTHKQFCSNIVPSPISPPLVSHVYLLPATFNIPNITDITFT